MEESEVLLLAVQFNIDLQDTVFPFKQHYRTDFWIVTFVVVSRNGTLAFL